jgi:tRNA(His) guanylyltransferase
VSLVTSCFTGSYVRGWPQFLEDVPLQATPLFDGRAVCYPTDTALRDYLSWRQADTHINTQYNTCYWALVKGGKTPGEAQDVLKVGPPRERGVQHLPRQSPGATAMMLLLLQGTQTDFKNELLFSQFGINYNDLPPAFRKASHMHATTQMRRPPAVAAERCMPARCRGRWWCAAKKSYSGREKTAA